MNHVISKNIRLNGNQLASKISNKIHIDIYNFIQQHQHLIKKPIPYPKLSIINVGNNIGSLSYIRKKIQTAKSIGIQYHLHQFNLYEKQSQYSQQYSQVQTILNNIQPQNYTKKLITLQNISKTQDPFQLQFLKQQLLSNTIQPLINHLNSDESTSALFIQLPLPESIKPYTQKLVNLISPLKDADCLTSFNRMRVLDHKFQPQLLQCTPRAVLKILYQYRINIEAMNAVMIGRSNLVGRPLSHLLLNRGATTTICHKMTKDVNFFTQSADLVVSATGVANLVKKVKQGSVLIDVGISRNGQGKLSGDICHEAKKKASFYTPVPGGVGPMTVVMLMENVYILWKKSIQNQIKKLNQQQKE